METRIIDIHCKQCGAPARYDIIRQEYRCGYCGGITGLEDAVREKKVCQRFGHFRHLRDHPSPTDLLFVLSQVRSIAKRQLVFNAFYQYKNAFSFCFSGFVDSSEKPSQETAKY